MRTKAVGSIIFFLIKEPLFWIYLDDLSSTKYAFQMEANVEPNFPWFRLNPVVSDLSCLGSLVILLSNANRVPFAGKDESTAIQILGKR